MAYATPAQIGERYDANVLVTIADRDGDGSADSAVLERALADASAEIDTYLAAKYDLPLSSTPEVLTRLAVDIAVYRLASEAGPATEERRQRYDDAVALLRRLASGEASLGLPSPGEPSRAYTSAGSVTGRPRRFSRETMRGLSGGAGSEDYA